MIVPIPPRLILADSRSSKIPPIVPSLLLKRPQGGVLSTFLDSNPAVLYIFVEAFPVHFKTLSMFWLVRDTEKSPLEAKTEKAPS